MHKAVLDTTVLISAFLNPVSGGVSIELLHFAKAGAFSLCISDDILEETAAVLLGMETNRRRFRYPDEAVIEYCQDLARFAVMVTDIPEIQVVRDPNDDMILACAIAARADFLISRDKDLLSLNKYQDIEIHTPEAFLRFVRLKQRIYETRGHSVSPWQVLPLQQNLTRNQRVELRPPPKKALA